MGCKGEQAVKADPEVSSLSSRRVRPEHKWSWYGRRTEFGMAGRQTHRLPHRKLGPREGLALERQMSGANITSVTTA